jgi:hypothetical protein
MLHWERSWIGILIKFGLNPVGKGESPKICKQDCDKIRFDNLRKKTQKDN